MNKPKEALETFTLVPHVYIFKTLAFACLHVIGLIDEYMSRKNATGTPVRSKFTKIF